MKRIIVSSILVFLISIISLSAQNSIATLSAVTAEGDGIVAFNGYGEVTIQGDGMLFIVDRTDTATITLNSSQRYFHSERETRGNTVHTYRKFKGTATIIGEDIAVLFDGVDIVTSISGTGIILVEGIGNYTLDDAQYEWSDEGIMIDLLSTEH